MKTDDASLADEHGPVTTSGARRFDWVTWVLPLALLCAAIGLQALAALNSPFIEKYYSRTLFPRLGHALSLVNGVFPFSLAEIVVAGLLPVLIGVLVYQALQVWQRSTSVRRIIRTSLLTVLWVSGSGLLLFLMLWGLNYHRQPLGNSVGLAKPKPSDEQLEAISRSIITAINSDYEASHSTACCPVPDRPELYGLIESAYQQTPLLTGLCQGGYARPKPVHLSGLMSWLGISGVYFPFTGEANFNSAQPDFDLPYVIAHEKAHQCGIAREDEANFIAFLVCANSTHPFVRYSGYLHGLRVVQELSVSSPDVYQTVRQELGPGPRADLNARAAFWARFQGRGMEVAQRVNNSYLKANKIDAGTRSYSEDVALIIAYYLKAMASTGSSK